MILLNIVPAYNCLINDTIFPLFAVSKMRAITIVINSFGIEAMLMNGNWQLHNL